MALAVVSTAGTQAACAVFAVDFPRRFQHEMGNSVRRGRLLRVGRAVAISACVDAVATVIAVNGGSGNETSSMPPSVPGQQVTIDGSAFMTAADGNPGNGGKVGDGASSGKSGGGGLRMSPSRKRQA